MTATKECKKCGIDKPETGEYFYRNSSYAGGLDTTCKKCRSEYNRRYNKKIKKRKAEESEAPLLVGESKKKILSRYQVGQIINMRYEERREGSNELVEKKTKVEILGFYPSLVLCLKDNCKECYNYQEIYQMRARGSK